MQPIRLISYLCILFSMFANKAYAQSVDDVFSSNKGSKLNATEFATFDQPWAMTFLPNGELLVTEKEGKLILVNLDKRTKVTVAGVPKVAYGGQGGLGDIIIHPNYQDNNLVYLSYADQDSSGKKGAVVIRAQLKLPSGKPKLENIETLWQQTPKVSGSGHYSHKMAFSPDGYLMITSGDRQKQEPAQSWEQNLGKIIRLNSDGSVPEDNPFQHKGELAKTFWSTGHRNMLGIAFDNKGQLWSHEMGPRHGDEFNLVVGGGNYGWPIVSEGNQYSGVKIPNHDTRPEFSAPKVSWVPTVAPSGLIVYSGSIFPQWQGDVFIGGLKSESLLRMHIAGIQVKEAERFDMKKRIREVEQGPKGAIWVLEDGENARLLQLTPSN
ncbi:PQQ-dependent sugar dehydrogenase [Thalassomonas sp. M1454]|uniref:PQQ-dependent sugar dehydrogenase n=1 Tax=Thalassomonas sp. M1454 TaxID=2594477 RepID=UPI00117FEBD4|nr:PQQ-dependent sugar dehydrogenase [Thalassomonas sp. M1454]TRX58097.1 PQQ-dependent sugar dehydrogenase [Thalassomonas sp. M1454]